MRHPGRAFRYDAIAVPEQRHPATEALDEAIADRGNVHHAAGRKAKFDLLRGQLAVQVALEQPLALAAVVVTHWTASSASCAFSSRRPRWSLDMTVPIGMSRICAASA